MRALRCLSALALMVLGVAGPAVSEPTPRAIGMIPWQVLPNTCRESTVTTRSDGRYETTAVADRVCELPNRHFTERGRNDVPLPGGDTLHRFAVSGNFQNRRFNERFVILTDGGSYWDPRLDAMAMRGIVHRFLEVTHWTDHRIVGETAGALAPGRYAIALVYDVTTRANNPQFVLAGVAGWFNVN